MLSGCSSDKVTVNGNSAEVSAAGVSIVFPKDWKVYSGNDIYEVTYSRNPDNYFSAEALKKDIEYRVNGYYTESSLTEETIDGVSGWLSDIMVFKERGGEAISEQREFMFEKAKTVYSLRIITQGIISEQTQKIAISVI